MGSVPRAGEATSQETEGLTDSRREGHTQQPCLSCWSSSMSTSPHHGLRIKLLELVLAFFCLVCGAPAFNGTQHWFLLVVSVALIGTIFFSLYHLCLAEPLNKLGVNWLMVEFWFTAVAAFLYFTAF